MQFGEYFQFRKGDEKKKVLKKSLKKNRLILQVRPTQLEFLRFWIFSFKSC